MTLRERTSIETPLLFNKIEGDISWRIQVTCTLISDILKTDDKRAENVRRHIINWFFNPDKGSKFRKNTRLIRWWLKWTKKTRSKIIPLMLRRWYNGIIAFHSEDIIGHTFFQAHKGNSELHLFSIAVAEELHKRRLGTFIGQTFLEHGRAESNVTRVRISSGWDPKINKEAYDWIRAIFKNISQRAWELGIETDDQFFVNFLDRNPRELSGIIEPRKEEAK